MRRCVMKNLVLRDPLFEDLFDFRREFDKIFNRILAVKPWGKEEVAPWPLFNFVPPVEAYVDKETKKYAEFVNGVLEITAPVATVALPRKIEIKATPMTKQIAA